MAELYFSIQSFSNTNLNAVPNLFQVVSDVYFGGKVGFPVNPWLSLGGDLTFYLPTNGDLGLPLDALGVGIRANGTADLRNLEDPFPLIARLNLQYQIDNTENLVDEIEERRLQSLPDRRPDGTETRHLLDRIERFGLGVNRTDFINIGIGFEAPLRVTDNFFIHPMVEWNWGIPVNR
ncbi:MAG: hypothetical protein AAGF12_19220, partial [Myxococcota bacterium]